MMAFLRAGALHDMAYTGPMQAGVTLDTPALICSGFIGSFRLLAKAPWNYPKNHRPAKN